MLIFYFKDYILGSNEIFYIDKTKPKKSIGNVIISNDVNNVTVILESKTIKTKYQRVGYLWAV